MTLEALRHLLGWCAVINYAMLMLWFILQLAAHGLLTGLSLRFFGIGAEQYDLISLRAMFYFKLAIFMFNLAPYLALRIMG
jgi:hypothetical protein